MAELGKDEINKLATLARVALSEEELERLPHDLGAILAYVSQLGTAPTQEMTPHTQSATDNALRADADPEPRGVHREELIAAAPKQKNGFVVVKHIFGSNGSNT